VSADTDGTPAVAQDRVDDDEGDDGSALRGEEWRTFGSVDPTLMPVDHP
jgi:hypothetical protein